MRLPSSSHPSPTIYAHPACISAWGGHYTIQAVAFDLLIAFSLLFLPHTRLPLYHHSSCNKIIMIIFQDSFEAADIPADVLGVLIPAAGVSAPCRLNKTQQSRQPVFSSSYTVLIQVDTKPYIVTGCGISCFRAQIAFSFTTFGHRRSIPPAVQRCNKEAIYPAVIKLHVRWGQFRSNQPRSPGVCPVGPLPQRAHWYRSLRRSYGRITRRPKLENPGSRCLSPLSTK